MGRKNILLTGPPRCGKSTLIEKLVQKLDKPMTGLFTREIKEGGKRVGFSIITLDGKEGILAHKDSETKIRLGQYGVHLDQLNRIAVPSITPSKPDEIIVIDEIGKMECVSSLFRETLIKALDSDNLNPPCSINKIMMGASVEPPLRFLHLGVRGAISKRHRQDSALYQNGGQKAKAFASPLGQEGQESEKVLKQEDIACVPDLYQGGKR